jgi:hypothetical protein
MCVPKETGWISGRAEIKCEVNLSIVKYGLLTLTFIIYNLFKEHQKDLLISGNLW